ncbi:MAG: 3-methyl-2-oxobutanoate hydroxymethyltransferase, partial [Sedimentisphaerales bacterium]|nr:3-methyl-2-oxobutanoate hydroxymethyltransferase [Sedimentisphaerales bacterium]
MERKITIADIFNAKKEAKKIAAVSCYDFTTARLVAEAGADMILVGDSAAQVILGHDSTLPITMDFLVALTAGVRRGAPRV